MKTRILSLAVVAMVIMLSPLTASATPSWVLGDWSAIIDGTTYNPPGLPASVNSSGFDFTTGLGSLIFHFDTAGPHYAGVYLYPYYDSGLGFGDVSDAYVTVSGVALPPGLSYQAGWPGVPDGSGFTVFDYFAANSLNGSNTVGAYVAPPSACCSVAMAEIYSFTLDATHNGTVTFTVTDPPPSGFYLQETDHDSTNSIYLTQSFAQTPKGPTVPEPGTLVLLAMGVGAVSFARRKKTDKRS